MEEDFNGDVPKIFGIFHAYDPVLFITDPEMLNELYITKNKYFDKHPFIRECLRPLFGDALVFQEGNNLWNSKRKVLSAAFYKDKLSMMGDIVKEQIKRSMVIWKEKYIASGKKELNVVSEISLILVRVILACAFGYDCSERTLTYYENGVKTTKTIAYVLRNNLEALLLKMMAPQLVFLPESINYDFAQKDKHNTLNAKEIRAVFTEIIRERRAEMERTGENNSADLLNILMHDELFKDNHSLILDECLLFFFAGSQTTACQISNALHYLMQKPELLQKVK
jgi:cytochrome P450